jgi:hypothetical protein
MPAEQGTAGGWLVELQRLADDLADKYLPDQSVASSLRLVPAAPQKPLYGIAFLRQVVEDLEARAAPGPRPQLTVIEGSREEMPDAC